MKNTFFNIFTNAPFANYYPMQITMQRSKRVEQVSIKIEIDSHRKIRNLPVRTVPDLIGPPSIVASPPSSWM